MLTGAIPGWAAITARGGWGALSDHRWGRLANTMGDLDLAATQFEDGLTFCRNAGFRADLAWTCHGYADLLLERHETDDKATALLDESLTISSELGMRPLMDRVQSTREKLRG